MFTVYTPVGRTFFGPLEHLRQIEKPNKPKRTRKQQDVDDPQGLTANSFGITPKAINAYKEVIKKPDSKEIIYHAYQIMSFPVHALSGSSPMKVAIEQFNQHPFQFFPIVNERKQLIGSVSRQQIYQYVLANNQSNFNDKTIQEVCLNDKSKVYAAEPITDVRRVAALMVENEIHALPILEKDGDVVGIVSRTDVLKAIMTDPPLSLWC